MKTRIKLLLSKSKLIVSSILFVTIMLMSIGFAYYGADLSMIGSVKVIFESEVLIEDITLIDSSNASFSDKKIVNYEQDDVSHARSEFTGSFGGGANNYITLNYKITNTSNDKQTYVNFINSASSGTSSEHIPEPRMLNLKLGDVLEPGESRDVTVIYYIKGSHDSGIDFSVNNEFIFEDGEQSVVVPVMNGSINPSNFITIRLNRNKFNSQLSIINLYNVSVKFTVKLEDTNGKVMMIDNDGNETSYVDILDASETSNTNIRFKINLNFSESVTTKLYIETENGERYDISNLTFKYGEPSLFDVDLHTELRSDGRYDVVGTLSNNTGSSRNDFGIYIQFTDGAPINYIKADMSRSTTYTAESPNASEDILGSATYLIGSRGSNIFATQWNIQDGDAIVLSSSGNSLVLGTTDGSDPWQYIEYITVIGNSTSWISNAWSNLTFGNDKTCKEPIRNYENVSSLSCSSL